MLQRQGSTPKGLVPANSFQTPPANAIPQKQHTLTRAATQNLLQNINPNWKMGFEDTSAFDDKNGDIFIQMQDKQIPLSQLPADAQQILQVTGLAPITKLLQPQDEDTDVSEKEPTIVLPEAANEDEDDALPGIKTSTMKRREKLKHLRTPSFTVDVDDNKKDTVEDSTEKKDEPDVAAASDAEAKQHRADMDDAAASKVDKLVANKIYKITIKEIAQKEMIYKSTRELTIEYKKNIDAKRWRIVAMLREVYQWYVCLHI